MRLRVPPALTVGLLLVALGAVTGATSARAGRAPGQNPAPTPTLSSEQLVALADQAMKDVEALRGWTFKRPVTKEMTSLSEMRAYLEQETAKNLPPARLRVEQALLRTVGLLPPDGDLKATWLGVLESQVGGFYVPETKTMHLVARPTTPPFVERIMLVHELTHALDDQYVDLEAITRPRSEQSEDQDLTAEAVIEGSATALMTQYATRAVMKGSADLKALQQYAQEETERSKPFLDAPRYFSAMLGTYICGTQFLARGSLVALMLAPDDKAIGDALVAARKDMPRSTEQILHPEKYWDAAKRDDPVLVDDDAAAAWLAQPGRFVVHADTLGEMLIAILTTPRTTRVNPMSLQSADAWTNAAASGWGGDRFYLLSSGESVEAARATLGTVKGAWVTTWDTPADRDEFIAAVPNGSLANGAAVDAVGQSVAVIYFGMEGAERATLTAKLRERMLAMTRDGKPYTAR